MRGRSAQVNAVYDAVRETFHLLGYDASHRGTAAWNPLGWLIRPGETVFIKPNMIAHKHALRDDWEYVITHGSVIRAVVDYVYIALQGRGRIQIGDGPQTDSKWDLITERMGLDAVRKLYAEQKQFEIELIDLRDEHWIEQDGIYTDRIKLKGDPAGKSLFDLGANSMFAEFDGRDKIYYGAYYDVDETNRHHSGGKHEYEVSNSPLAADVFINIPKLKTHKKCGLTVNLKSLVGINANKNCLPHYIIGSPETGGDQFDKLRARGRLENTLVLSVKRRLLKNSRAVQTAARRLKKLAYRIFGGTEEVVRSGNWHGNDTVWRMCLDLNRILLYGRPGGKFVGDPKKFFSLVDGIVAMEGNGPVAGDARSAGLIIAGDNPVAVDAVCARLMGFDENKLPLVKRAFDAHELPLMDGDISVVSSEGKWSGDYRKWQKNELLNFRPHFGWTGHVELE
ncbi:MAG TPA: DUF362 domain-containing protein [Kiritimatiellia bacterium]|nr:DUF362 domain-containing protein [Kiritimatiellia bacterium]